MFLKKLISNKKTNTLLIPLFLDSLSEVKNIDNVTPNFSSTSNVEHLYKILNDNLELYSENIEELVKICNNTRWKISKYQLENFVKKMILNDLNTKGMMLEEKMRRLDAYKPFFDKEHIFVEYVKSLPNYTEELNEYLYKTLKDYHVRKVKNYIHFRELYHNPCTKEEKQIMFDAVTTLIRRYEKGKLSKEVFNRVDSISGLLSVVRTGHFLLELSNSNNLELDLLQINNINTKHFRSLLEIAKENYGELTKENIFKMYFIFGKQRTAELLGGRYGKVPIPMLEYMLEGNFSTVKNYKILNRNNDVEYTENQKKLIRFLFASGPNDDNSNIKKIISGEITPKQMPVSRLIREWDMICQNCNGNPNLQYVMKWLSEPLTNVNPVEKNFISTLRYTGAFYRKEVFDLYEKMMKRYSSTIPKVKGNVDNFEYEILDLNDPKQMEVGYITSCCFTFGGAASSALTRACSENNDRIFVVRKDGDIIAQSWVWRKGNVLCFDNIETTGLTRKNDGKILKMYKRAADEILTTSEKNEEKPIQIVTVGKRYGEVKLKGRKLKEDQILIPKDVYTDASEQVELTSSNTFSSVLDYETKPIYLDPRQKILAMVPQNSKKEEELKTIHTINKINYISNNNEYESINLKSKYDFVFYTNDWFIGITKDGIFEHKTISVDPRANEEIKNTYQFIQQQMISGKLSSFINDDFGTIVMNEGSKKNK